MANAAISNDTASTGDVTASFPAMASTVTVRLARDATAPDEAIDRVREVFRAVESQCTRFDPQSPLMQANTAGEAWQIVPGYCFAALTEAASAHRLTGGMFDPRVLQALLRMGYDRSLPFAAGSVAITSASPTAATRRVSAGWLPRFDPDLHAVRVGPVPVDLGGIAKGLAVRWAAEQIAGSARSFLIEAGGDCYLSGDGPEGDGWQVAVEDPRGGAGPIAVLTLRDTACATSSIRLRHWTVAGRAVHHLIDPRTGESGGAGLLAVTVVGVDPAMAEVWSKVLFLSGRSSIAAEAASHGVAALWVADDGTVGMSECIAADVIWLAS